MHHASTIATIALAAALCAPSAGVQAFDDAQYPEPFASMAFRVGIDYVMYSMTH